MGSEWRTIIVLWFALFRPVMRVKDRGWVVKENRYLPDSPCFGLV